MASPFRIFRKHQKAFLAIAAVLAMFIFVVGDAIMGCVGQAAGGRGGSPNAVVTTWDGGSLTVKELDLLSQRRYFLNEFLANLYQLGKYRAEAAGETPTEPDVPAFFLPQGANRVAVMGRCVEERILADQGREVGMSVSDMMINDYLRKLGFQRVSDEDIRHILEQTRRFDMRTAEEWLFSGLRELLLGNLYANSVSSSVMGISPEQLWIDWRRVNDRIALEAVILPVEKFVPEVPEPTEAQLITFYERYKNRIGGIPVAQMGVEFPSPEPGFREPRRVKLKYLLGDVTAWTQEMLASVTDEEIVDYYERNKRTQFVKLTSETETIETEDVEESDEAEPSEEASADAESDEDDPNDTQPGEEASADVEPIEEVDEEEDIEYEPLDKVKDDIRNQLANDKAVLELKRVMESAYGDLTTVFNRYGGEVVAAQAEEGDPPPVPVRLAELAPMAKEKKLAFEETVPLSELEMFDTMVGKAMDVQSGSRNVTKAAFTDLRLYEPFLAQDLDGYWYLVLKVDDQPSYIPELKDIREQVAAAWKRSEAAKLALKKSEELARDVEASGKTLADVFTDSDYEVTTTDLFSWITFGNTPVELQRGPRLGDAPPLTAVGNDFMQRAFDLKGTEVIGMLNFDHSQAYVLQLARRERTEDELRTAFLEEVGNSQAMRIMENSRSQNNRRLVLNQIIRRVSLDIESLQKFLQSVAGK